MSATRQASFLAPMNPRSARSGGTLRWAMLVSVALHVGGLAAFVLWKGMAPPARPPQYRIELIGAAGLKKQMGVVAEKAAPVEAAAKPVEAPPKAAERPPEVVKKVSPVKTAAKPEPKPTKATPNQAKAQATPKTDAAKTATKPAVPVAGSGQAKGRGTDVTNMLVEGIQFPFPGYLDNIMRQVILAFDWNRGGGWAAEVRFVIHRDGSVTDIQILKGSGSRPFDLEARGAIESVGNKGSFGPLPAGFGDDVLPVYYTFRPADKNL